MKVALVTTQPAPYRIPVWDAVASRVGTLGVYLCTDREPNRIWDVMNPDGYRFTCIYPQGLSVHVRRHEFDLHVNPSLPRLLSRLEPDAVVVTGYQTPSFVAVIAWARARKIPLVLWWESHAGSSRVQRGPIAVARKRLIHCADAYVTVGQRSAAYLVELGVPPERISRGVNAVDVERLRRSQANGHVDRDDDRVKFLYVGQLIERKGVQDLLAAFEAMPRDTTWLRIVGYGPLEDELRDAVRRKRLHNVEFAAGTKTLEETAAHYSWADFLVMPSRVEVWGLVVNEALACGLPVLASRQAGCTPDLVECAPICVGLTFDAGSIQDIGRAIQEAVTRNREFDRGRIAEWGRRFTPGSLAASICTAVEAAVTNRAPTAP